MVNAATASAGNERCGADERRLPTIAAANAQPTAAAASSAHAVSANWGASRTARPSIHEMPVIRVASQKATATALMMTRGTATNRLGRIKATRPAPNWAIAHTMNRRANWGCSACTPAAAAWMTPAPIDVIAAMVRPGTRVVGNDVVGEVSVYVASARPPSPGAARVMCEFYECRVRLWWSAGSKSRTFSARPVAGCRAVPRAPARHTPDGRSADRAATDRVR